MCFVVQVSGGAQCVSGEKVGSARARAPTASGGNDGDDDDDDDGCAHPGPTRTLNVRPWRQCRRVSSQPLLLLLQRAATARMRLWTVRRGKAARPTKSQRRLYILRGPARDQIAAVTAFGAAVVVVGGVDEFDASVATRAE